MPKAGSTSSHSAPGSSTFASLWDTLGVREPTRAVPRCLRQGGESRVPHPVRFAEQSEGSKTLGHKFQCGDSPYGVDRSITESTERYGPSPVLTSTTEWPFTSTFLNPQSDPSPS